VSASWPRTTAFVPGVHDAHLAEDPDGQGDLLVAAPRRRSRALLSVLQELDPGGGRGDPFLEDLLPEESVDHGALAGVELAHHHQQEELVELGDRAPERLLLVLGERSFGPDPPRLQARSCGQDRLGRIVDLSVGQPIVVEGFDTQSLLNLFPGCRNLSPPLSPKASDSQRDIVG
jgi:hypothetical protein